MATNPSAASRNSSRAAIIDNALARARAGATISLESAARASGLSKPGLMYHFKTKTSLMAALVDRLVDSYERELVRHLNAAGGAKESVHDRYAAYLDWACTGDFDASDLVMFLDPRLREALTAQWVARMDRWLVVPADTPARLRTRLLAARLMAEGVWFGAASGALPLAAADRLDIRQLARDLIKEKP